jgi:hypothetical protein
MAERDVPDVLMYLHSIKKLLPLFEIAGDLLKPLHVGVLLRERARHRSEGL